MNRNWAISTLLVLVLGRPASAQLVERVIDGDTVSVVGVGAFRLIGIERPENQLAECAATRKPAAGRPRSMSIAASLERRTDGRRSTGNRRTPFLPKWTN